MKLGRRGGHGAPRNPARDAVEIGLIALVVAGVLLARLPAFLRTLRRREARGTRPGPGGPGGSP